MATELIVPTLPMVEINGAINIPTVLAYSGNKIAVGEEAISLSRLTHIVLNEDFKIDLGHYDPSRSQRKRFRTGNGDEKSAAELTSDFLNVIISKTREWLAFNGLDIAPSILLAEPLECGGMRGHDTRNAGTCPHSPQQSSPAAVNRYFQHAEVA